MPEWTPQLLLLVFMTHLPFFAWRWARTREIRYAATTLTFFLLCIVYALRVFAPEARIGGVPGYAVLRVAAWSAAAVSIGLLLRHHLRGLRTPPGIASADTDPRSRHASHPGVGGFARCRRRIGFSRNPNPPGDHYPD
jgi:hypothetical protein